MSWGEEIEKLSLFILDLIMLEFPDLATGSLLDWQGLGTGNLQSNISSIRVENEEESSQISRHHTTDFKAVIIY